MQNKGAIRLFAIILALVCVYQLMFTVMAIRTERKAEDYANGNKVLERRYLDSISDKVVYNFLWMRKYTFEECKEKEINLGLDLKGGMDVVLEISVEDVIKSVAAPHYLTDPMFAQTLQRAQQKKKNSQEDFVNLFASSYQEINPGGKLAQFFMTPETRGEIDVNTSNDEVVSYLKQQAESAVENSFNVLRNRIDRFGVVQPNIQRLERQGRILVELPGVDDPDRVARLLTGTANLEFWTTYENSEVIAYLQEANNVLRDIMSSGSGIVTSNNQESGTENQSETASAQKDTSEISLFGESDTSGQLGILGGADTTGVSSEQEQFQQENPLFAVLTPYVDNNGQPVPGSVVGVSRISDTATVDAYLHRPQVHALFPGDLKFYWDAKPLQDNDNFVRLYAIKSTRDGRPSLAGTYVTDARMTYGQFKGEAEVSMSMNSEGAKKWANLTRENVGKSIAIVLDGYVVSAPVVRQEIKGGSSSISGNFTQAEATDLANILNSGKMPARARIISEEVIGPSLGQASINAGMNSFLIAFVIVLLYMVFYYSRSAGLIADIALVANMFFLIGVLASLQAVLTLPGIAGIVLTIGMSVDANVLIYERIREEITAGKGTKLAIADGYKNAYSAIIDANVTTLLTGIILYLFGTGPIKGFATTLVIGILTSLFSAIFITRLIYERQLAKDKTALRFSTKLTDNAFKKAHINFIGLRKIFYVISGAIVLAGALGLIIRGLNTGVDFTGGRNYVIQFTHEVNPVEIRGDLGKEFGEMPGVITFGEKNTIRITTKYMIDSDTPEADSLIKSMLFTGLKPYMKETVTYKEFMSTDDYIKSVQKVGPTIADDIKVQAVEAIVFALIMIFLYIIIRFRNWQYGLGAVLALVHDVTIVLGAFALFHDIMPFSMEIDQAFIAAILTVVGYSINDTVVVFDRIREYRNIYRKRDNSETMNLALNSTLSRTFSTSLSTFFVILAIFIFGGEVIRGFTFALLIGIVVGTYSSLFIATPIAYDTFGKKKKSELEKK